MRNTTQLQQYSQGITAETGTLLMLRGIVLARNIHSYAGQVPSAIIGSCGSDYDLRRAARQARTVLAMASGASSASAHR